MKILSIELEGFKGLKKFNFKFNYNIPENSNVILIKGENGYGKTTVLENLHPYPEMITRKIKDSIIYPAKKIIKWKLEKDIYTSVIQWENEKTTKGFLYKNDNIVKETEKGNITEYIYQIEKLLEPFEKFKNSVFLAQNSLKIIEANPNERLKIINQFLPSLKIYDIHKEYAKEKEKEYNTLIKELKEELNNYLLYEKEYNEIKEKEKFFNNEQYNKTKKELTKLESEYLKFTKLQEQKNNLEKSITELENKINNFQNEINKKQVIKEKLKKLPKNLENNLKTVENKINNIKNLKIIFNNSDSIEICFSPVEKFFKSINEIQNFLKDVKANNKKIDEFLNYCNEKNFVEKNLINIQNELKNLESLLNKKLDYNDIKKIETKELYNLIKSIDANNIKDKEQYKTKKHLKIKKEELQEKLEDITKAGIEVKNLKEKLELKIIESNNKKEKLENLELEFASLSPNIKEKIEILEEKLKIIENIKNIQKNIELEYFIEILKKINKGIIYKKFIENFDNQEIEKLLLKINKNEHLKEELTNLSKKLENLKKSGFISIINFKTNDEIDEYLKYLKILKIHEIKNIILNLKIEKFFKKLDNIKNIENELKILKEKIDKNKKLKTELENYNLNLAKLNDKLNEFEIFEFITYNELKQYLEEYLYLKNNVNILESKIKELTDTLNSLDGEKICPLCKQKISKEHLKNMKKELANKKSNLENFKKRIKELEKITKNLISEFNSLKQVENYYIEYNNLITEIKNLSNQIENLKEKILSKKEIEKIETEIQFLENLKKIDLLFNSNNLKFNKENLSKIIKINNLLEKNAENNIEKTIFKLEEIKNILQNIKNIEIEIKNNKKEIEKIYNKFKELNSLSEIEIKYLFNHIKEITILFEIFKTKEKLNIQDIYSKIIELLEESNTIIKNLQELKEEEKKKIRLETELKNIIENLSAKNLKIENYIGIINTTIEKIKTDIKNKEEKLNKLPNLEHLRKEYTKFKIELNLIESLLSLLDNIKLKDENIWEEVIKLKAITEEHSYEELEHQIKIYEKYYKKLENVEILNQKLGEINNKIEYFKKENLFLLISKILDLENIDYSNFIQILEKIIQAHETLNLKEIKLLKLKEILKKEVNNLDIYIKEKEEYERKLKEKENLENQLKIIEEYTKLLKEYKENIKIKNKELSKIINESNKYGDFNKNYFNLKKELEEFLEKCNEFMLKKSQIERIIEEYQNKKEKLEEYKKLAFQWKRIKLTADKIKKTIISEIFTNIIEKSNQLLNNEGTIKIQLAIKQINDNKFNIYAIDLITNTEVEDISLLSGAEKATVQKALSIALSTQTKLKNLWIDEADASLSESNKNIFIEMLDKIKNDMNFEQIYLISHNPLIVEKVDEIINLKKE